MNGRHVRIAVFSGVLILFAAAYTASYASHGFVYRETEGVAEGIGGFLGSAGFLALALVYARTVLKALVRPGAFWERFVPLEGSEAVRGAGMKAVRLLTVWHPYMGVVAGVAIFLHCYFTGTALDNLLLRIVLALLAWQVLFGFVLQFRYTPAILKRKLYLVHIQLVTGVTLLVFAGFGHLVLGD